MHINQTDIVKLKETLTINPSRLEMPDITGFTLLHYAMMDSDMLGFLLELGANPNIKDAQGNNVLHLLAKTGMGRMRPRQKESANEIIQYLVDHDADIHALNKNRLTPLHLAAENHNVTIAEFLLEFGAQSNIFSAVELGDVE